MLQQVQKQAVGIVSWVAFYLFGFFMAADALALADDQIVIGLPAGLIAGLAVLVTVVCQGRANGHCSSWLHRNRIF
jgi:hypothetical protein